MSVPLERNTSQLQVPTKRACEPTSLPTLLPTGAMGRMSRDIPCLLKHAVGRNIKWPWRMSCNHRLTPGCTIPGASSRTSCLHRAAQRLAFCRERTCDVTCWLNPALPQEPHREPRLTDRMQKSELELPA